jgi:hypothetical protein
MEARNYLGDLIQQLEIKEGPERVRVEFFVYQTKEGLFGKLQLKPFLVISIFPIAACCKFSFLLSVHGSLASFYLYMNIL